MTTPSREDFFAVTRAFETRITRLERSSQIAVGVVLIQTDSSIVVQPGIDPSLIVHAGVLTEDRFIDLLRVNSASGATTWRIVFTGSGADIIVRDNGLSTLRTLATGEWCDVAFVGGAYMVTAS